jgi:Na+/melibiose symporter-like transporter
MSKMAHSVGGFALIALAWIGYDTAVGATHTEANLLWLSVLYAIVPTVAFAVGLYLCWTWPLTPEKHTRLQRLMEIRQARFKKAAAARV